MTPTTKTSGVLKTQQSGSLATWISHLPESPYANPTYQIMQIAKRIKVALAYLLICLSFSSREKIHFINSPIIKNTHTTKLPQGWIEFRLLSNKNSYTILTLSSVP